MNKPINIHFKLAIKIFNAVCLIITLFWGTPVGINARSACTHYVATDGNDTNAGTSVDTPWKTIQKSADTVGAGDTVCVRGGIYNETVSINVSGSSGGGYITFQNYQSEQVILDGSSLTVPSSGWGAMIQINNREYIIVKGFEIRNYKTSLVNRVPMGIFVNGTGNHIELRDNIIHNIETNYSGVNGGDAHGIAVYGTSGATPLNDIIIDNNQLYDLKLGSSESLVVNGNVNQFWITNNIVHDNNNIGIDAIGFEGTASANDQARNGIIRGNIIYNINSFGNPAYGNERSAGCIYVDGGTHIVIESNIAHHCNVGVELASEHKGKATSYVTLRNNLIYSSTQAGISIGGYDTLRGSTENSTIVNNTLYNNATQGDWGAELYIQYDTRSNIIQNNIISNPAGTFIESWSAVMSNNSINFNLFFSTAGAANGSWIWKDTAYSTLSAYRLGSGNDANSSIGADPLFIEANTGNFQLGAGSPGIDTGNDATCAPTDKSGITRPQGLHCDIGAYEYMGILVNSITRANTNPTYADSVEFTVIFNKPATGVDISDFTLVKTGDITGESVTTLLELSANTYVVTINTGTGSGTIRLDVTDDDTILDADSNPLGGSDPGNGNFTSGQAYVVRPLTLTVSSTGAQDGWVLESGENTKVGSTLNSTATTFRLGDNATKKQYRSILSFSTKSLPDDATITGVTLKIRKQGIIGGGNPVTTFQGFMVDIKKGYFGTSALQTADFQTTASRTCGPFKPALSSNWYSIDLTGEIPSINKVSVSAGLTQIRLRFKLDDNNNTTANYLSLYSGNASSSYRPQLVIEYYVP
jgi:hypothetical protein